MTRLVPAILAAAALLGAAAAAVAAEPTDPSVRLYDTGRPLAGILDPGVFLGRSGWTQVSDHAGTHRFTGSAVALNHCCAVVFREAGRGAEVFAAGAGGYLSRAFVWPWPAAPVGPVRLKIVENEPTAVEVEPAWTGAGGERLPCRLRLAAGEPIVRIRPGEGVRDLRVASSSWHVVTPDFLGDDAVSVAGMPQSTPVGLPAENVVLGLLDARRSMLVCMWEPGAGSADLVTLGVTHKMYGKAGEPESLRLVDEPFAVWRIGCDPGKPVWVSCLEGPDLWQREEVVKGETPAGVIRGFKPPFPAKWRADFVGPGGVCDSITFEEPPDAAPVPDTWRGPVVIYPIDRSRATPLTTLLPVDILRATLGVGPCEYILDVEGLSSGDIPPTPAAVTEWVEKQFKRKRDARVAEEIRERLDAMVAHLAAARARIADYAVFGRQVRAVCRDAAKKEPAAEDMRALLAVCDRLDRDLARGREAMAGPEVAAGLASEIAALVGKTGALAECEKRGERLRAIGQAHDATLARCRMAVRRMAAHCRSNESDLAKQVHAMAETMLRSRR